MNLKVPSHSEFWHHIFPVLQKSMPALTTNNCDYKIVVPFKIKGKNNLHVGVYEREFNKVMFIVMSKSASEKEMLNPLHTSLYVLMGKTKTGYTSSEKDKYEVPLSDLGMALTLSQMESVLHPHRVVAASQLDLFPTPVAPTQPVADEAAMEEEYNHVNPNHYKSNTGLQVIDVINAFFAHSFQLGNTFKYMARAGKKPETPIEVDLKKGMWYLIDEMKKHMSKEEIKNYLQKEIIDQHL